MNTKRLAPYLLALFAGIASPSMAEEAGPGPEIAGPDLEAAQRQGFEVVDWNRLPAAICTKIKNEVIAPLRARNGHREPFGLDCASARVTGAAMPEIIVLARGAGPDLNDSSLEGHKLLVLTQNGERTGDWRVVLSTQAQEVGLKPGEIASIQPDGLVRYAWNGRTFTPSIPVGR
ncbi:hypothetical protein [Methylobacterium radiotolerans]|uniref:hypothetical protein n=1 Tax=Methylobacterium radiotolerans TaxID=31998 RepID=UPI001F43E8F9|nr:hypothetical protein [Methylobacterium radiotolerans]UIY45808.1 hypothetical protein LZ599_32395 [Methylobacterium radiotolerans]